MSLSNASRKAPAREDVPPPKLGDLTFESNLRRSSRNYVMTVDRRSGARCLGVLFPAEQSVDEWERNLDALTEEQGVRQGLSLEAQQQARQRREEPVSDPAVTTRTLSRRG